jgi:hypothetical protein
MKTVLVIDGAENCAYDCFEASDALFARIFPAEGQDVEFIEDYMARSSEAEEDLCGHGASSRETRAESTGLCFTN